MPSLLATLAVALSVGVSAQATVLVATYTGTVAFAGYDTTGEFGAPASDLTGLPFTATFTYDTSLGDRQLSPGVGDGVVGGPALGFTNPLLDSTLTIKSVTAHFPGNSYAQALAQTNSIQHVVRGFVPDRPIGPNNFTRFELAAVTDGTPPDINFTFGPVGARGNGYFEIFDYDDDGFFRIFANGQLNVATISVLSGSEVPEPATWTIMIAGFGVIGAAHRRHRQRPGQAIQA